MANSRALREAQRKGRIKNIRRGLKAIGETPSETPYVKEKRVRKFLKATNVKTK